ncbi:MAG: ThiF family adenylyltransferase [bacterium]|nr:ThiF family adenylyltransferase [bacterium]
MQSNSLAERLAPTGQTHGEPKPQFFDLSREDDQARISELLEQHLHLTVIDRYEQQLKELFVLDHPTLYQDKARLGVEFAPYRDARSAGREPWQAGVWAYLPWREVLLHLLPDAEFQHVRTARNRNLIPPEEQEKYYNSTIGIAGLSVGNSVALALVLMGGGKRLRLADHDTLELTNLNRIRGSIADLTKPKAYMTAQQIYELDPYADLTLYTDGLTEENIQAFFDGPPTLDVVIDEIDNLGMKLRIRAEAKKRRIPVVMATDNGDSGMVDVERYDLDPNVKPFHGRLPEDIAARIRAGEKLPLPVVGTTIGEHLVGWDITEPHMQESLLEIGKTIPTWPQLGGAAVLNGVGVAVTIRKILTGQPVTDRRALLSLPAALVPNYDSPEQREQRSQNTQEFVRKLREIFEQMAKR